MPLLFSMGQGALEKVSRSLKAGEHLCDFLNNIHLVCEPDRVRFLYGQLAEALSTVAGIRLHQGKTRVMEHNRPVSRGHRRSGARGVEHGWYQGSGNSPVPLFLEPKRRMVADVFSDVIHVVLHVGAFKSLHLKSVAQATHQPKRSRACREKNQTMDVEFCRQPQPFAPQHRLPQAMSTRECGSDPKSGFGVF